ncbi:MAG: bifunctional glutamate N-acetyltransferase/amino-acid acetyltransferase ArgJ [Oscillospiraceae bacterium]|nr:bifunctional glutamate N-acetyltransferase/amino-acid acetyltransferase ArgJ [Oscillospiraceae bacterium]
MIDMDKFPVTDGGICAAKGYKASGYYCGIKAFMQTGADGNESPVPGKKNDIALVVSDVTANAAGVYTSNKVKGAPVTVTKANLAKTGGRARAVIANSGNANTCNADGEEKALAMCRLVGDKLGIPAEEVIVASTGVIGQILPLEPIQKAIDPLYDGLSYTGNVSAATAIMTTDTVKKEYAVKFTAGGKECTLGGMAKGSGMIHPNMATTLNFITTDCAVSSEMLQKALSEVVKITYNCLSVDGDQSTNDMCMLMANGLAGNAEITSEGADFDVLKAALTQVMANLTRMLAKDGEGATKLVTCVCTGAPDLDTAIIIAKSVIRSPLVKCAMYGADANCGRIMCAMGYADTDCDVTEADVYYISKAGRILVCEKGLGLKFDEDLAKSILEEDEIEIFVDLHRGSADATAWGCDLTYDYVKINGDYRS